MGWEARMDASECWECVPQPVRSQSHSPHQYLILACCVPSRCQAHLSDFSWGGSGPTLLGASRTLAPRFLLASGQAAQHPAESGGSGLKRTCV